MSQLGRSDVDIQRRRFHRVTFIAAGCYNILWGLFAAIDTQWLFRFARMEPMVHPQILVTLGMVVGVYGLLYLEVARRPEEGFPIAAVGLLGKILGPLGWLWLWSSGAWPMATIVLILTNDIIWWIPFGLYLRDSRIHYLATFR